MGNRLSKIYTRTGDAGTTGLGDGDRVAKDNARVEAYGTVDETNSAIGMVLTHAITDDFGDDLRDCLLQVQHHLFDLGGELCMPGTVLIGDAYVDGLEATLDAFNADLEPLKEFILPGGGPAAAACHLARTICRRAERRVVTLAALEDVNPVTIRYLNRLSDLLFVIARRLAKDSGHGDQLWDHQRK